MSLYFQERKKSTVLEGVAECTHQQHTHVCRHADTEENEHNLPVGYILLLMDHYWFYCL